MRTYTERQKELPIKDDFDLIVVGGGPAGVGAAYSAGKLGSKTLLIEQMGGLGGVATTGLMSHWTGGTRGGVYEEILDRSYHGAGSWQTIHHELLKTALLEMMEEAHVTVRLYTLACEPIMENDSIIGVITESKSGREAFLGKYVIDASGDGDIAARAGVPFQKGRPIDNKMQPMTLMFRLGGVDIKNAVLPGSFETNMPIPGGLIQDLGKQHIPHPAGHVLLYAATLPNSVIVNMTNVIEVDGTNAEELTKAQIVCRKQIDPIVKFIREFVPGFKDCYVIDSASQIGVRETRHFEGLYTLTEDDILTARVFDDWVVSYAHFNFDVHNISGSGLDATGVQKKFSQSKGYTIPLRCLVPKKIRNLLIAGRNISGTHIAHSSFRAMPICTNTGQAAGTIATFCIQQNKTPSELSIQQLQEVLIKNGMMEPKT